MIDGWKRQDAADRYWMLFAGIAVGVGAFFRFWDLGGAPLAVDEYFFGTSMLNVADQGVPAFPCAGYYTRGILIQYLSVPLLWAGASLELTTRFWPAVASLLSVFAVWRIARLAGGVKAASIAVILASLSLWEIEFARFGRMYAPFQAVFLWYVYFQIRHLVEGSESARWTSLALSAVSVFVYAGASFLLILNFLPLVWRERRWSAAHLLASAVLLVGGTLFFTTDFRHLDVPAEAAPPASSGAAQFNLPINLPLLPDPGWPILLIGAGFAAIVLQRVLPQRRSSHPSIVYWAIAGVSLCFGLFGLGMGLVIAGLLMQLPSPFAPGAVSGNRPARLLAAAFALWLAVVTALFAAGELGAMDAFKQALRYTLDYPDVYWYVVRPWLNTIPVTSMLLAALALPQLWILLAERERQTREWQVQRYCAAALILLALLTAFFRQPYSITRYTYFLYPLVLVFASVSIAHWSARLFEQPWRRATAVAAAVLLLFAAEDFGIDHLVRINEPAYRFRTAYERELDTHYYTRWDFRDAARYVNERLAPADSVIVFDQPLPHYLDRTSGVFVRAGTTNHRLIWGCDGTRDLWSNAPLLDTETEVQSLIGQTRGDVWVIMRTDRYPSRDPLEIALPQRYSLEPEFVTIDRHLAVYRLPAG